MRRLGRQPVGGKCMQQDQWLSQCGVLLGVVAALILSALSQADWSAGPALDCASPHQMTGPRGQVVVVCDNRPGSDALRSAALRLVLDLPIEVNTASEGDLQLLPGVGPKLAARIVRTRREGGPFHSLADLQQVKGIGPAKTERLRGLASFESPY